MYLFIPDYRFARSRMDERIKRAESVRRADEVRRAGRPRLLRTVTVLDHAGRQVSGCGAFHLRVVE